MLALCLGRLYPTVGLAVKQRVGKARSRGWCAAGFHWRVDVLTRVPMVPV